METDDERRPAQSEETADPKDPARGGDPDRDVERDEGPLDPNSPTLGGSGGSGGRAVLPGEPS